MHSNRDRIEVFYTVHGTTENCFSYETALELDHTSHLISMELEIISAINHSFI